MSGVKNSLSGLTHLSPAALLLFSPDHFPPNNSFVGFLKCTYTVKWAHTDFFMRTNATDVYLAYTWIWAWRDWSLFMPGSKTGKGL